MRIFVNGDARVVPEGTTVRGLIQEMKLDKAACAAEVNRALVPRRAQETTTLKEDDRVELVVMVGGG